MPPRAAELASVVECVWMCRRPGATGTESVLPSGRAQLVIGLDASHRFASFVGPLTRPRTIESAAQRRAIGVVFRPGGLTAVTGWAASDAADDDVGLDAVTRIDVTDLLEHLCNVPSAVGAVDAVERVLCSQLAMVDRAPSGEVWRAIRSLENGATVPDAAANAGAAPRRLRRTFRDEVGMTPKRFARLQRFRVALSSVRARPVRPLAEVAVASGYADQAHMTRDFVEFGGVTPGAIHGDGSSTPTHLAG